MPGIGPVCGCGDSVQSGQTSYRQQNYFRGLQGMPPVTTPTGTYRAYPQPLIEGATKIGIGPLPYITILLDPNPNPYSYSIILQRGKGNNNPIIPMANGVSTILAPGDTGYNDLLGLQNGEPMNYCAFGPQGEPLGYYQLVATN